MSITPVYVNRIVGDDDRRTRIFDGALCRLHASAPNELDRIRYSYDRRTFNIEGTRLDPALVGSPPEPVNALTDPA